MMNKAIVVAIMSRNVTTINILNRLRNFGMSLKSILLLISKVVFDEEPLEEAVDDIEDKDKICSSVSKEKDYMFTG